MGKNDQYGNLAGCLKRMGIFLIFACFTGISSAQSGLSRLDGWMEANAKLMGGRAILLIYKDGNLMYSKSVSDMNQRQKSVIKYVARKQGQEPDLDEYTLNSRQLIASCSKWLSAALVMTYVDEGKLKLTDTVGTYLPVLSIHGKGNITISECLSHLTGIKAPPLKESIRGMLKLNSMDEAMEEIAKMPMEGTPGKVFHYSNVGLQIAGAVIEKISGHSFQYEFAERIAKPLGLKNTDFGHRKLAMPAGSASSTPEDYLAFLTMILRKGNYNGKQILSEKSINEMEINRVGPDVKIAWSPGEAEGLGYGFGEWTAKNTEEGKTAKWMTSPGLFGSFPWVDSENHYCAFLMTFYMNNKGRVERDLELKRLVDESVR